MENFYDVRKIYGQVFSFFLDAHKSCADKSTSGSGTDPPDDGWNRAGRSALRRFSRGNFSGENTYTVDLPPASRAPRPSSISFLPLSLSLSAFLLPFNPFLCSAEFHFNYEHGHDDTSRGVTLEKPFPEREIQRGKFSTLTYFPVSREKWCLACVASCRNL